MSATNVYASAVTAVEALTPSDTSRGEPSYRFHDGQIDETTLDRAFNLRITSTEPVNQISTAQARYLTEFILSVRHMPSQSLEADEIRMAADREQLIVILRDKSQHHADVEAILQDTVSANVFEDDNRVYTTEISFVAHHI